MRAFVLSGGGNYGPLQVGALQVLMERGLLPDMLVGTSAGAMNAAWLACHPSLNGLEDLARLWRITVPHLFSPVNPLSMTLRLGRGQDGLLSNDSLRQTISRLTSPSLTFADLTGPRLYLVATRLQDGALRVFGDDPRHRLLDGLMASSALPPVFPPWWVDGEAYIDGAFSSNLPLLVAVERGADEIFALKICSTPVAQEYTCIHGILGIGVQTISLIFSQQTQHEIDLIERNKGVRLHLIRLWAEKDPGFWNFDHADALITDGRRLAQEYLHCEDFLISPTFAFC